MKVLNGGSSLENRSLFLGRRLLLLPVLVFLCLILNTVGAGAQTGDDHGNTFGSATPLSLGSSINGRIDPGNDVDVFRLDLSSRSGVTDVWVYATGDLDTWGGLYDGTSAKAFMANDDSRITGRLHSFHLRASLGPAVYYVGVFSSDGITTGDYTVHTVAVDDPGNAIGTATPLDLNTPTPGRIDSSGDSDYFRLDLPQNANFHLYARSVYGAPIGGDLFDSFGNYVRVNHFLWDDGFYIRDDIGPGTYYVRVSTFSGIISHAVHYTIHVLPDIGYTNFLARCVAATQALNAPQINDALYGCQWHLRNQNGEDINVEPVWAEGIKGEGINIALLDDGMDVNHEDLTENFNTSLSHSYTDTDSIFSPLEHHGTYVAGVVAARDNGVGVRGVAPRASIIGYDLLLAFNDDNVTDALTRNASATAVSNNSWGLGGHGPGLNHSPRFWELAVNAGVTSGYSGKGIFYAFSGGNHHLRGGNANLEEIDNHNAVTAVCAVNDKGVRSIYSEVGANLWICAPSGDRGDEHRDKVTTENFDRYYYRFSGTSSAAPIVSGVAALMRQANPNLTWRDLKLILAASARKNDPTNSGWEDGSRKYGSTSPSDRYHFNHEYGFGVVDAKAAVDLARAWTNVPSLKSATVASNSFNFPIPDLPATLIPITHKHDLTMNTDIDFVEFVEINVAFNHPSFRDLDIELVSPTGSVSKLTVPFNTYTPNDPSDEDFIPLNGTFRFGSAKHLGENPNGVWQLRVSDQIPSRSGTWDSWEVKVYGHSAATISSQCAAGTAVPNPSTNAGLVSDCESLLEARDVLVGTGSSLNWSATIPMTSWDGITVWGTPTRVTEISLQNKGLRGAVPTQLGRLTELNSLRLSTTPEVCQANVCRETLEQEKNQLTGPIPPALGNLSKLESLTISRNRLTGPMPIELRNLNNLSLLAFGGNQLSGTVPSWLGNLSSLERLFLWGNEFTGPIPTELTTLTNLTWLELGGNRLSGSIPVGLSDLISLERLTLHGNQLIGSIPPQLGDLSSLRVLSLWGNQLTGSIPASLTRLVNLESLFLRDNQLTGCIPAGLRDVPDNDLNRLGLLFCNVQAPDKLAVSMTATSTTVRFNSPVPVTATFTEPVYGFTVGDVRVANGSASNFVGTDGDTVYTFDVSVDTVGIVTVNIPADVAADTDSNGNTAAVQLSLGLPYDDDNDGRIGRDEVVTAIGDYLFSGALSRDQMVALIGLYLFG